MLSDRQTHKRMVVNSPSFEHFGGSAGLGHSLLGHPLVGIAGQLLQQSLWTIGVSRRPHADTGVGGISHLFPLFHGPVSLPGGRQPGLLDQIDIEIRRRDDGRMRMSTPDSDSTILIGPT